MNPHITYLGLDIAKLTLDLSPHPAFPKRSYANDPAGLRSLITALRRLPGSVHIICEATGGYEHLLANPPPSILTRHPPQSPPRPRLRLRQGAAGQNGSGWMPPSSPNTASTSNQLQPGP